MTQLKLLDAEKARTYGVPTEDTTYEKAIAFLKSQSTFDEQGAQAHLQSAIEAGVYTAVGYSILVTTRSGKSKLTEGDNG